MLDNPPVSRAAGVNFEHGIAVFNTVTLQPCVCCWYSSIAGNIAEETCLYGYGFSLYDAERKVKGISTSLSLHG